MKERTALLLSTLLLGAVLKWHLVSNAEHKLDGVYIARRFKVTKKPSPQAVQRILKFLVKKLIRPNM